MGSLSHRWLCSRALTRRNGIRLHMIGQRQGEEQVRGHREKSKGSGGEHPE